MFRHHVSYSAADVKQYFTLSDYLLEGQAQEMSAGFGGKLLFDEPVVIQCCTSEQALEQQAEALREFLHRMGREARQGAVGLVIDRDYLEIGFAMEPSPTPRRAKSKKRR